jgi:hypothetical protein
MSEMKNNSKYHPVQKIPKMFWLKHIVSLVHSEILSEEALN